MFWVGRRRRALGVLSSVERSARGADECVCLVLRARGEVFIFVWLVCTFRVIVLFPRLGRLSHGTQTRSQRNLTPPRGGTPVFGEPEVTVSVMCQPWAALRVNSNTEYFLLPGIGTAYIYFVSTSKVRLRGS